MNALSPNKIKVVRNCVPNNALITTINHVVSHIFVANGIVSLIVFFFFKSLLLLVREAISCVTSIFIAYNLYQLITVCIAHNHVY